MKKVIVINGSGGSGKDLFVELVTKNLFGNTVFNFSSIDPIKKILITQGWDGVDKSDAWRLKMVNLKKELIEKDDTPTRYLLDKINSVQTGIIFVHIREPEEIEKLKLRIPSAYTLHVNRSQSQIPKNVVDQGTANYKYDQFLENSGETEDSLNDLAKEFIVQIIPYIHRCEELVSY